jgi:hypothetical protein
MRLHPTCVVAIALSLGACFTGPAATEYAPALSPAGVRMSVRVGRDDIRAELLETRDSGIVVLAPDVIAFIPFSAIRDFTLAQERSRYAGGIPTPAVREHLRLRSRFPHGLSPEQLARLLAAQRQDAVRVIGAPGGDLPLDPRADSTIEAAFLEAARAATHRYQDLAAARADGYRRIGGELPSLGEHWLHNGRALADTLDPAAPPILVYARVDGRPTLAGVAYTRLLGPGDGYPAFPHTTPDAWHEHNGGVGDEVLPRAHHAPQMTGDESPRLRIVVMHAWIWIANPAGVWASENWGLPYARLGLSPDAGPGGLHARGVSLVTGASYYSDALLAGGALTADEESRVRQILSEHAGRASVLATSYARQVRSSHPGIEEPEFVRLWESMWEGIGRAVGQHNGARVGSLRPALEGRAEPHRHGSSPPR